MRLEINFEESSDDLIYSTPRHDIQVIYPPTSDATATANDGKLIAKGCNFMEN